MKTKLISPAFSLKGWKLGAWLKGIIPLEIFNSLKKCIKELLKIGVSAGVAYFTASYPLSQVAIGVVSKSLLDVIDFYFKDVTA
jgi:hypothetical protein